MNLSAIFANAVKGQTEILIWFLGTILVVILILFIAYKRQKEEK